MKRSMAISWPSAPTWTVVAMGVGFFIWASVIIYASDWITKRQCQKHGVSQLADGTRIKCEVVKP